MTTDAVREQYERFPYPPIPRFALPRRGEGAILGYERGTKLCFGEARAHEGIRILVAGAGTFEALVVAQQHPRAAQVLAVDLSAESLKRLRSRARLARLSPLRGRIAPLELLQADLMSWDPGAESFDYVLASNVLHHLPDPAEALARLSTWLKPQGILRMVTYPKQSRYWMRETSRWLKAQGVRPGNTSLARKAIEKLPTSHPIRLTFENHPEVRHPAGLVDAFFHPLENPLSPYEWERAAHQARLSLRAEDQDEGSRSDFLAELLPETSRLSRWERLQVLDDVLELCANPVMWLAKGRDPVSPELRVDTFSGLALDMGLARAKLILQRCGLDLETLIKNLREKVGPRTDARGSILSGLTIWERPES